LIQVFRDNSAEMAKSKKREKKSSSSLDRVSEKKPRRGRPGVRREEIAGRAYHYGLVFDQCWKNIREQVLRAKTADEVTAAFKEAGEQYFSYFVPHRSETILKIVSDSKFPKRAAAQIRYLADSLAGVERVTPRRSRDIVAEERNRLRHRIVRQDYYIACACGYEGPALKGACQGCGTREVDTTLLLSQRFGSLLDE
jgi:hypothetical protein